ncbi:hypothetical protein E8E11_001029 [Didymella keratinophila]|nr:hypothetical protein E8E11_001029 [Didymella keratinophila]
MPVEHSLSFDRNLLITTPNSIHLRTPAGDKTVFECESDDGIVNACAAPDNSSLLAIADSHGVLLHDAAQPRNRKHKLKGGGDTPRLIHFSPDSHTLFFSTALNNSVHTFSLPTGDLLSLSHSHLSPPSVLAVSSNGNFLLSASASPPTVLIQDIRRAGAAAVDIQRPDTSSAVTCAAFETFSEAVDPSFSRFVLGFKDGTLALYKMTLPSLNRSQAFLRDDQSLDSRLRPFSLGAMSKLHKAAMGGVIAAAFIPGYTSRVGDAVDDREKTYEGFETMIAVGTQAGKVLAYDVLGLLIHEIVMNKPIRAVAWVGDMSAPSILPARKSPLSPEPGPVIKKLMEEVGKVKDEPLQPTEPEDEPLGTLGNARAPDIDRKSAVSFSTPTPQPCLTWQLPNGTPAATEKYHLVAPSFKPKRSSSRFSEIMMSGALPTSSKPPTKTDSTTGSSRFDSSAVHGNVAKQSRATSKKRKLADIFPAPKIAGSSSHSFSSSLYSRPKSRVFRNRSKALDGGADAMTPLQSPISAPRRSFSFETGLHEVEAVAEQRYVAAKRSEVWTGGKRSEISRLRTDNEALQQQISSLREEFKTLKDVLLQAETHRRWEARVS